MIPFFSLKDRNNEFADEIHSAFSRCLDAGAFIGGTLLSNFESEFSRYLDNGLSHVVGVANGLDALRLILEGLGLGPGDEVIVPGFTFVATWLAVSHVGATIVPVDVDLKTANISLESIWEAVTEKTRAVIVVHLFGRMALSPSSIKDLQESGLYVIEDAAQAHGSSLGGSKAGTVGTAAAFSFYPTKNLGCLGDGGAVVTKDAALSSRIRSLANYGATPASKYINDSLGWNSRLDPMQAAFLSIFLPQLDRWNSERRNIAQRYLMALEDNPSFISIVGSAEPTDESVWHLFVVQVEKRNSLMKSATEHGIQLDCHYPHVPIDMPAYMGHDLVAERHSLANSRFLASTVVSLPLYPQLTVEHQNEIISAFKSGLS